MCRDQSGLVVAQGGVREEWGETANGYQVSFGDDENVLELESGDDCTTLKTKY